jgi:hypothetical protein
MALAGGVWLQRHYKKNPAVSAAGFFCLRGLRYALTGETQEENKVGNGALYGSWYAAYFESAP